MTSAYQYTPYIWPMLASAAFMAALCIYLWRQRSVPGALPLATWMLLAVLFALCASLELAATDASAKIFWFKCQAILVLPSATAMLCFALEYASPGRWVTRRTLALLAVLPILTALLVFTNDARHWMWPALSVEGYVRPALGYGAWMLTAYGSLLVLLQVGVLLWLFAISPPHRWPIALMLVGRLATAVAFPLEPAQWSPFAPVDASSLAMSFTAAIYALALFRFRILDLIPIAHETVIQQMREGMLILDVHQRIVDLNRSAEKILGTHAPRLRGRKAIEVLPASPGFFERLNDSETAESEISLGAGDAARYYAMQISPLRDRRGVELGHLLLLHDVTEQRRAQQQFLEQQRVVATLEERQRLARELHDGVGQMLGYVSMQAQAIRKWVHDGETATAEAQLTRLAAAAQDAHEDIRESILSLKAGSAHEWDFLATLHRYLAAFQDRYGIATELTVPAGMGEQSFAPVAGVQLLRVIQEALANARKHGRARCVRVVFGREDGQARIAVTDDGCGFDPGQPPSGECDHLGLDFMRDRMAQIGGCLTVHSKPGAGTELIFQVPIRDESIWGELPGGNPPAGIRPTEEVP
jgi:PAS domain S-box-containing protein